MEAMKQASEEPDQNGEASEEPGQNGDASKEPGESSEEPGQNGDASKENANGKKEIWGSEASQPVGSVSLDELPDCPRWGCSFAFLAQFAHHGGNEGFRISRFYSTARCDEPVMEEEDTVPQYSRFKPFERFARSMSMGRATIRRGSTAILRHRSEKSAPSAPPPTALDEAALTAAIRGSGRASFSGHKQSISTVCTEIIKPLTKSLARSNTSTLIGPQDICESDEMCRLESDTDGAFSFAELALRDGLRDTRGNPAFAEATHFVSHAWQFDFKSFVAALSDWLEQTRTPEDGTYFWVDAFVVNQHKSQKYPQEWWSTRFMQAIADIGHTVVVLEPWDSPVPFTRAWCIWELYCTIVTGSRLHLTMTEQTRIRFNAALVDEFELVQAALSNVDVSKSQAFFENDRDMIHGEIKRTVGFSRLNELIQGRLVEWLTGIAKKRLTDLREMEERAGICPIMPSDRMMLQENLARMCREAGNLREAEDLFRALVDELKKSLTVDHAATLSCMNQLAVTLRKAGKGEEALAMHRHCLERRSSILGAEHADSLQSASNLAVELSLQQPLTASIVQEAESLFRLAIRGREVKLGADSPVTLYTVTNLAKLLTNASRDVEFNPESFHEAAALHRRSVRKLANMLNEGHPLMLTAQHNQACFWMAAGILKNNGSAVQSDAWFLPKFIDGEKVLVLQGDGTYKADNTDLESDDNSSGPNKRSGRWDEDGLKYLLTKDQEDIDPRADSVCKWGSIVHGEEDGTDWIRVKASVEDEDGLALLRRALDQLRRVHELRKMHLGTEHQDSQETARMFGDCSKRVRELRTAEGQDYGSWAELCSEEYQTMSGRSRFREVRQRVREYGAALIRGELERLGFVDGLTGRLTTGSQPFNVFARLAAGVMEQPSMVNEQEFLGAYQKHYQIVCNKPENDDKWDSSDPAWIGKASMSKRHRILIVKDLNWEWFNTLTFGLVSGLDVGLNKLKEIREAALCWVSAHEDWPTIDRVGLFVHVYALCSVYAFHLHILDMDNLGPSYEKLQHRNLALDDAIRVLEQEILDADADAEWAPSEAGTFSTAEIKDEARAQPRSMWSFFDCCSDDRGVLRDDHA